MKKMFLSALACFALMLGAVVAFCAYLDVLAALLLVLAFIPSLAFEEGRKEYVEQFNNQAGKTY